MKINIISILAPLAAAAIFAGCSKTAPERTWSTDPDAVHRCFGGGVDKD